MTDYGEHCEWLAGEGVGSGNLNDYEAPEPETNLSGDTEQVKLSSDLAGNSEADTRRAQPAQNTIEPAGFAEWLDAQGDAMAAPDSFSQWLKEHEDSI